MDVYSRKGIAMKADDLTIQPAELKDIFFYLVAGMRDYQQIQQTAIPPSLRKALNQLAFHSDNVPKTLYNLCRLCHTPIERWYPFPLPDNFDASQPLLYDGQLSEEAESFWPAWAEQVDLPLSSQPGLLQRTLESQLMRDLLQRLRAMSDIQAAQAHYVQVRSFLIEHSCATGDQLRACSRNVFQDLRLFFEPQPRLSLDVLLVCDRYGLLEYRDGAWYGVKPDYCSDHAGDSPHVHAISNHSVLYRLKRAVHQRVFIPGRLELALFEFAEAAQDDYPDHLIQVERYPGLDAYDLRLTFQSGDTQEVWAIEAKDLAHPDWLALQIRPMYGEGELAYDRAFYVIPDERLDDEAYRNRLEHEVGILPPKLHLVTLSAFKQQVTDKLVGLARPPRR